MPANRRLWLLWTEKGRMYSIIALWECLASKGTIFLEPPKYWVHKQSVSVAQ